MNKQWIISIVSIAVLSFAAGVFLLAREQNNSIDAEVRGATDTRGVYSVLVQAHSQTSADLSGIQIEASQLGTVQGENPFSQILAIDTQNEIVFSLPEGKYLLHPVDQESYAGSTVVELKGNTTVDLRLVMKTQEEAQ
ncbi:MAG: hypothetical protein H6760_01365 [Candidatus Nomurabacteria bacterium]|nr:MAG: hypothetical protein H6760_01365 [Candidatus Nomurabacteria bacterium]